MSKINTELKDDPLMPLRHTAEHVLHTAMQLLYPNLKKVMGPPIGNGFYFDFDLDQKISDSDFERIESLMAEIITADLPLVKRIISAEDAKELFASNPYKLDTISEIESRGEEITVYEMGGESSRFHDIDLCSGPHAESTGSVKAFKLLSVAGAYYKGNENNKMLTRIYATAFDSQENLTNHLELLEETKKRDHRKIGRELELFTFAEEIGPGLPLWLPKGTIVKEELERWGKETEDKWGYVRVSTPIMTKRKLFEISSHVPYFEDEMYKVQVPGDKDEEYFLKPMNCPFHHMIFKSKIRSYRELPLRMAEYGTVARYENAGALNGILRPRYFVQNDAHVYCTQEQAIDMFVEIIDLHRFYYDALGLKDYYIVLALRDPSKLDKYHGNEEMWKKAEELSKAAMDKAGIRYEVVNEGAAHYGPKMDFKIKSVIGNEYGISTNQIDLYMPERFDLKYTDKDGQEKYVVVQHRAPLGSSERFVGFLIEHFAGAFPLWLSPVQAIVIPISETHLEYAYKVQKELQKEGLRVEVSDREDTMQAKIRQAQEQKIPYMLIVGDREAKEESVSVRLRTEEKPGTVSVKDFAQKAGKLSKDRSLTLW